MNELKIPTGYVSAKEYADKHDRSIQQIKLYIKEGRIPGAKQVGKYRKWYIPADAPYPQSRRATAHETEEN